jgi:hypothetical protein
MVSTAVLRAEPVEASRRPGLTEVVAPAPAELTGSDVAAAAVPALELVLVSEATPAVVPVVVTGAAAAAELVPVEPAGT